MTVSGVTVPAPVAAAAGGRDLTLVWVNEADGLTFAAGEGAGRRFIKWAPAGSGLDLPGEAERLAWAGRYHPVPQPLDWGQDDEGAWLVTAALPGDNAVSARWTADPATAVTAIGEGLRALHEALPVEGCPFSWSARRRVTGARGQAAAGRLDPATWHPCHRFLTVAVALEQAAAIPPPDRLVVCHGDACAPNTLLGGDGRWSGHVDLGLLGVPTGGPTWPSLPGAPSGTTAQGGNARYSTPTGSARIRNAPGTTACCGTLPRYRGAPG